MTYPSLAGIPLDLLPGVGNTSLTIPGSYLSVSCPVFGLSNQTSLTDYTSPDAPLPDNGEDCTWVTSRGAAYYQLAVSMPCNQTVITDTNNDTTTRRSRKLVWESRSWEVYTRAECHLTTTYVDTNVTCSGSTSSGSSAGCIGGRLAASGHSRAGRAGVRGRGLSAQPC